MASSIGNDKLIGLSARFKQERLRLGLTQAQAADVCGVSRQMIGLYESATSEPGISVLAAMTTAGADAVFILTGKRQEYQSSEGALSEAEAVLLESYRKCSKEGKTAINLVACELSMTVKKQREET